MNADRTPTPAEPIATIGAWRTVDLMVVVVVSLVFGAIYTAWGPIYEWSAAFGGPPTQEAFNGLWFIAALLGPYLIRRPGVAIAAEVLACLAEMLVGAPWGPSLIIYGVLQSIGAELVFFVTGYRRWGTGVMIAAGVTAGIVSLPYSWWDYGYLALDPSLLAVMGVTRIVGVAVAGLLAQVLGDGLVQTGVLNGVAIGRARLRDV